MRLELEASAMKVVVALVVLASVAHANPATDITKTLQAFVETGGTSEAKLVLFIPPQGDSPDEHFEWPVLPHDRGEARGYVDHPKLAVTKLVVSKSGISAWVAAEIHSKAKDPLRASAVLVKDKKQWHVIAAHWSRATPARPVDPCKSLAFEWRPKAAVPALARPPVIAVMKALNPSASFTDVMSDSGNAVLFGPADTTIGGAAIKNVFSRWKVTGPWHEPGKDLSARAGVTPDGELAWMALEIGGPPDQCTDFRTLFVLASEPDGWKLVHQHYSLPAR
jgi:ketosteroid isomerase-like protein